MRSRSVHHFRPSSLDALRSFSRSHIHTCFDDSAHDSVFPIVSRSQTLRRNLAARKNVQTSGVQRRKISAWSPRHLAQCIVKELPPPRLVPRQSRRRHQLQQRPWDRRRRGGQLRKRRPQRGGKNVAREPVREGVLFSRDMSRPPCEPEVCRKELKRTQERHKRRVPA